MSNAAKTTLRGLDIAPATEALMFLVDDSGPDARQAAVALVGVLKGDFRGALLTLGKTFSHSEIMESGPERDAYLAVQGLTEAK